MSAMVVSTTLKGGLSCAAAPPEPMARAITAIVDILVSLVIACLPLALRHLDADLLAERLVSPCRAGCRVAPPALSALIKQRVTALIRPITQDDDNSAG